MKRVIIIGATSGIGYEIAKLYLERGDILGIAGRREQPLQELQFLAPEKIEYQTMDITQNDTSEKLHSLIKRVGGMDLLLLCSGVGHQNRPLNPEIEINTAFTNVDGFIRITTAAFNFFKNQGWGHLAIISSIAGTKGLGSAPAYSATKCFQNTYIDALAQLAQLEKLKHIWFTDIRPGFVATDLLKDGNYPLLMKKDRVAKTIIRAIDHKKRVAIIDYRYAIIVFFWKLIPRWIWERLPVKSK